MVFPHLHPQFFEDRIRRPDAHIPHDQDLFQLLIKILINVGKAVKNAVDPIDDIIPCFGKPFLQPAEKALFFLTHSTFSFFAF